ncbi:MAG: metallophosphoesterase [Crocinitomicaceae bacterium]
MKLKILHISDFHYKSGKAHINKQKNLIDKFKKQDDLNDEVDLIIFSGDLVQNGSKPSDFEEAKSLVLDSLRDQINLDDSRIVLCPGNHDVDRKEKLDSVIEFMDNIDTIEDLEKFLKKKDFDYSCKPSNNYVDFVKKYYIHSDDEINTMYSTHIRKIKDLNLGIVTINSAWRAIGNDDNDNLLFPPSLLSEALGAIHNCEFKILVVHHPLSDFRRFNSRELEDLYHANFDLILSGHVHKGKDSIGLQSNSSVINIAAPAALTFSGHGAEIGMGTIKFDLNLNEFSLVKHLYDQGNDVIYEVQKGPHEIPTDDKKKELNRFRKKIVGKLEIESEIAKDLLVSRESDLKEKSFLEICADPVLKAQSASEINEDTSSANEIDWNELSNPFDDFLILGKGKCGKTVLLRKVQIDVLHNYSTNNIIPYFIDCKEWNKSNKSLDLVTELHRYYELNRGIIQDILINGKVLLLLDNFQSRSQQFSDELESQIEGRDNIKIIACSDETILNKIEEVKIEGRAFSKLYFHRLRKKHIKQLTKRMHNLPTGKQDEIVDKINSIFNRMSIPFNFWTVSLFLWIFKKDLNSNFQNDVELINLYIEKLLEKERLTVERSSFGFDKYKRYLANLSHYLLTVHHDDAYCSSYTCLIEFTDHYLKSNPRYNVTPKEVLDYIEDRGIIGKTSNGHYSFRLNGVFEYFIAHYMTFDKEFLEEVISDDNYYLSFANEFELYAGFRRDDEKFLEKVFGRTKSIYQNVNEFYMEGGTTPDLHLKSRLTELLNLKTAVNRISDKLQHGLSAEEQDKIEEELLVETGLIDHESQSEVQKKQMLVINDSIESLEISLNILGGVYRNIDEIRDQNTVYEIFDYIIDSACNWGFKLIDEIKINDIKKLLKTDHGEEAKELLRLITNFIPTVVETKLNEIVGHRNLETLILEKIEILKKDWKNNQYKLFLLYFLLSDINLIKYGQKLEELIDMLTIPVLKYSSNLKLNYYLGFKSNDDKNQKLLFQRLTQKQQLNFDKKTDLGALHKDFSEKNKKKNT